MLSSFVSFIALVPGSVSTANLEEYVVREVRREASFAGRLGQRVREELVLEQGGRVIVVEVAGAYHTMCVHPSARLEAGGPGVDRQGSKRRIEGLPRFDPARPRLELEAVEEEGGVLDSVRLTVREPDREVQSKARNLVDGNEHRRPGLAVWPAQVLQGA